jgi:hypothetical protein
MARALTQQNKLTTTKLLYLRSVIYCNMWAVSRQRLGKHRLRSWNSIEHTEVHCYTTGL